jgi:threonyl-tRNA synthetase
MSSKSKNKLPDYVARRLRLWEDAKSAHVQLISSKADAPITIRVGSTEFAGISGRTTPASLRPCPPDSVVCLVDNQAWDLTRPLDHSCSVEFLDFSHPIGRETLWHSAAHVVGQALELHFASYRVQLDDGPALPSDGFFYDALITPVGEPVPSENFSSHHPNRSLIPRTISPAEDFPSLTKIVKHLVKQRQPFERVQVSLPIAREVFAGNIFKQSILDRIAQGASIDGGNLPNISLYRCGTLVDLCRGPHVPHTGVIKALELLSTSSLTREGGIGGQQRVYGVAFPDDDQLAAYKEMKRKQAENDHRLVGKRQGLFMFHEASPGSPFFLPHGTRIYNTLVTYLRGEYKHRGFEEVRSPLMYNSSLWRTSGHWDNYRENMFLIANPTDETLAPSATSTPPPVSTSTSKKAECPVCKSDNPQTNSANATHTRATEESEVVMGMKPMNCPGHCLIFASAKRSYRDLPIRFADFSALHRNEVTGSLGGLTRTRCFSQDDGHIFCMASQVHEEIEGTLAFIRQVYKVFGFSFKMKLSTRPDKYVGDLLQWEQAEAALKSTLTSQGLQFEVDVGGGAFYGPKIDVAVQDSLGRAHQCATIQLDFNLPVRFGLSYVDATGRPAIPVLIHRALLGSVERMMAILMEHTGGDWPLWLSPRQVLVCPVSEAQATHAIELRDRFVNAGFWADTSKHPEDSISKKVRQGVHERYNYIVVVGDVEMGSDTVTVRKRGGLSAEKPVPVDSFVARLKSEVAAML